ncbi:MAG: formate dehydrogenase accessory protein FdhE [Burkholderiaceae bacterium]|nr:formate dehydrogenase accessory protein FdhE [Burkholderiaceae bacterium]
MATPIITDGTMDKLVKAPRVVLPSGAGLFKERATRCEALAANSDTGAYLRFLSHVCRGQSKAYGARQALPVSERAIANSREHGMPPLSAHVFPRDPQWRSDLRDILESVESVSSSGNTQLSSVISAIRSTLDTDPTGLEAIADRLIAGLSEPQDGPMVPFVGAALQVYFTRLAATLSPDDVGACDVATVCPCCGMRPTASLVRIDPDRNNYRYLICALCMTEWNMERVKCTSCEEEKGVGYLTLEAEGASTADAAVRAETCDECKTYLKIFVQEKDPQVDPIVDDLNSLALDMLVDEKGYARTGPNLLFYPGHE